MASVERVDVGLVAISVEDFAISPTKERTTVSPGCLVVFSVEFNPSSRALLLGLAEVVIESDDITLDDAVVVFSDRLNLELVWEVCENVPLDIVLVDAVPVLVVVDLVVVVLLVVEVGPVLV